MMCISKNMLMHAKQAFYFACHHMTPLHVGHWKYTALVLSDHAEAPGVSMMTQSSSMGCVTINILHPHNSSIPSPTRPLIPPHSMGMVIMSFKSPNNGLFGNVIREEECELLRHGPHILSGLEFNICKDSAWYPFLTKGNIQETPHSIP